MTSRERFLAALRFEKIDRLPIIEWAPWWDKTMANWKQQGLTFPMVPGLDENQSLQKFFGLDLILQIWAHPYGTHLGFRRPDFKITDEESYERAKAVLFPWPCLDETLLKEYARRQASGEAIVWLTLDGPFWGPRDLFGIEEHLFAFYDSPELMHRMNRDICEYNLRLLEEICKFVTPDFMTFAEDMSYNLGPMIGEDLFNEFLLPYYQKMVPELKKRGVIVLIDSDGDITRAMPWFQKAGIEGILPLERQAGVDLYTLRKAWPDMKCIGHFDKMTMPKGKEAMRVEFERLLPAMRQGGYIVGVDHQTPPGVTLTQYYDFLELFHEYAEKAVQPQP